MIRVSVETVLLLLVCARASPAAAQDGGVDGRSFAYFPEEAKEQKDVKANHSITVLNITGVEKPDISDQALQFLTGAVSTVFIPSFYTLVCVISVPINICAVLAFARRIRPKKPAAIYMLNLACADLLFAALLPFKISYHFSGNDWIFGPLMCRVVTAAFYWNMYCSVLLITCISVDRLLAIVYPINSLTWRKPQRAVVVCFAMWVLSLGGSVPLVLSEQTVHLQGLNITTCHDVQMVDQLIWYYRIYFITLCCAFFFLPLLITVVSYAQVIWSLSRVPRGTPGRSRRKTRAMVMALTVLVMFVLCFMPTNCLLLAHYIQFNEGVEQSRETPEGSYAAYLVFVCVGSLNCLLDPLLYYFGSSQCQRELTSALRCQKFVKYSSTSGSTSGGYKSSSRGHLQSCHSEVTTINPSATSVDSCQGGPNSQYKKLLT